METYRIQHLTFTYPGKREPALSDVDISIEQGEFVTFCGKSGCGKSTLLRHLKSTLSPHGDLKGEILFEGTPLSQLSQRTQTEKIGFVLQSPDNQIVTDKVWHELAFGLESLGYDTPTIRLRVAEMASFFGIQTWFHKSVTELSGGQRQLLNLAAVMAMQPSVLILDEPTSQLDPIAAADFLETIGKINRELGTTILLTEHRLEEALPMSDRVIVMDRGRAITHGSPAEIGRFLKEEKHDMFLAMPTPMRVYARVDNDMDCPITVRDGRNWLNKLSGERQLDPSSIPVDPEAPPQGEVAVELEEVWFRYERDLPDVVKSLSARIYKGEFYAIVGGNGTGKTTSISLMAGLQRPYRGRIKVKGADITKGVDSSFYGKVMGILLQNPQALFVKKTVELDLLEMFAGRKIPSHVQQKKIRAVSRLCELDQLMLMHPYDLSGGEQQRAALAKILLLEPEILVLDEPTKGLDGHFKEKLAGILKKLQAVGVTVIMVSHDIEFCASYADRCAMFFDGAIVGEERPRRFFSGKSFYTTAANRMARTLLSGAVLAEDIILACHGDSDSSARKKKENPSLGVSCEAEDGPRQSHEGEDGPGESCGVEDSSGGIYGLFSRQSNGDEGELATGRTSKALFANKSGSLTKEIGRKKLTPSRIAAGAFCAALFIVTAAAFGGKWVDWRNYAVQFLMLLEIGAAFTAFFPGGDLAAPDFSVQTPKNNRKLSRRTIAAAAMILIAIPFTIYLGIFYLDDRKYYFISMLIILETMLPFVLVFEGRKPQARELVVISVLCAIGVAGRAAFFMLPQFKPVMAVVIIAGVCFGGEAGFLTGAVTMFVSNMMFSQGPWTPWQMFAAGVIGFLAGVLFRKGLLRKRRNSLCLFGFLSTFFLYGVIMDTASALMWQSKPTLGSFLIYYMQGLPFNIIHGVATAFFLWFIAASMIEKLERIKLKYGLMEPLGHDIM